MSAERTVEEKPAKGVIKYMRNKNFILARVVGVALAFTIAVCGCGGGGGGGAGGGGLQADTTPPTLQNPSVNPSSVGPTGGSVTIKVTATDNVAVQSVSAVITGYNPATQATGSTTVNMTKGTGNMWSGQHTVPPMLTVPPGVADANGEVTYTVVITATDTSNNKSTANTSFKVTGLPPGGPKP
ncbi:MAG: hypothetical protein N3B12_00485 [Armatimonadetes bacterium]|nr:hypothetical protein [Armatimonadota bacterium]